MILRKIIWQILIMCYFLHNTNQCIIILLTASSLDIAGCLFMKSADRSALVSCLLIHFWKEINVKMNNYEIYILNYLSKFYSKRNDFIQMSVQTKQLYRRKKQQTLTTLIFSTTSRHCYKSKTKCYLISFHLLTFKSGPVRATDCAVLVKSTAITSSQP